MTCGQLQEGAIIVLHVKNIKQRCNNCQMFQGQKKNDLSAKEFGKKLKLYSQYNNLYFISPSKWLFNCASNSALAKE